MAHADKKMEYSLQAGTAIADDLFGVPASIAWIANHFLTMSPHPAVINAGSAHDILASAENTCMVRQYMQGKLVS